MYTNSCPRDNGKREYFPGSISEWLTLWMTEKKQIMIDPGADVIIIAYDLKNILNGIEIWSFRSPSHNLHVFSFKKFFHFCSMTSKIILHKYETWGRRYTWLKEEIVEYTLPCVVLSFNTYLKVTDLILHNFITKITSLGLFHYKNQWKVSLRCAIKM